MPNADTVVAETPGLYSPLETITNEMYGTKIKFKNELYTSLDEVTFKPKLFEIDNDIFLVQGGGKFVFMRTNSEKSIGFTHKTRRRRRSSRHCIYSCSRIRWSSK